MVRVACEDGEGSVNLLGQYNAGELMRQRHPPQRKKKVGPLACCSRPPISGPDGKHQTLYTVVANAPDVRCELLGGVLLTATIQQNGIGWDAPGLAVQPVKDGSLGVEELRVAGAIPATSASKVRPLK